MKAITPMFDRVVMTPREDFVSTSGIHIPKTDTERVRIMNVTATGADVKSVRVGDVVLVPRYFGAEFLHGGTTYTLAREIDILGKLED
ncbi:MAG: co-chaperone GroES family protein [Firmicutes bacterium]|nr:co-chaperone GroES family protein [Bacillota bacterium]